MDEKDNKINVYSPIEGKRKRNIPKANYEFSAFPSKKEPPAKVPNNYVFHSYKRFDKEENQNLPQLENHISPEFELKADTIPNKPIENKAIEIKSQNKPIENKAVERKFQNKPIENKAVERKFQNKPIENKAVERKSQNKLIENKPTEIKPQIEPIEEEKIISHLSNQQKSRSKTEKNFFINLMLFLNLALFVLIIYNQFAFFKLSQNLIQQVNSSFETFEQEIQNSTDSVLQELKNLNSNKNLQELKSLFEKPKSRPFIKPAKIKTAKTKPKKYQLNIADNAIKAKPENNFNFSKPNNNAPEIPKALETNNKQFTAQFSAIKLPPEEKGYKLNLSGQPEKYSAYQAIQENFVENPTVFYKSRK